MHASAGRRREWPVHRDRGATVCGSSLAARSDAQLAFRTKNVFRADRVSDLATARDYGAPKIACYECGMTTRVFWKLDGVSNAQLERDLQQLLVTGAVTEAHVVAHLAELDARRLHAIRGQSLWSYCQNCLGFSDFEAYMRINAARLARRFPIVFEMLASRQLHLTALCEARCYLTPENHRDLLHALCHKTKTQIRKLLATHFPKPDVPTRLRKLPPPRRDDSPHALGGLAGLPPSSEAPLSSTGAPCNPYLARSSITPLSATRYRLQLTLDELQKEKLELARNLLSHANPAGDLSTVLERALDALIENLQKRRFGQTNRPRSPRKICQPSSNPQGVIASATPEPEASAETARATPEREATTKPVPATPERESSPQTARATPEREATTEPARATPEREAATEPAHTALERAASPAGAACCGQGVNSVEPLARHAANSPSVRGGDPPRSDCAANAKPSRRRRIPNALLRQILARDGMRCTFTTAAGYRCDARTFLEIHHDDPWARGGADTLDNLRLLCRDHNRLLAERDYGAAHVANAITRAHADESATKCADATVALRGKASASTERKHERGCRTAAQLAETAVPSPGTSLTASPAAAPPPPTLQNCRAVTWYIFAASPAPIRGRGMTW